MSLSSIFDSATDFLGGILGEGANGSNALAVLTSLGLNAAGVGQAETPKVGYQGGIPNYRATRQRLQAGEGQPPRIQQPQARQAPPPPANGLGVGDTQGRRYFAPMEYETVAAATGGLASLPQPQGMTVDQMMGVQKPPQPNPMAPPMPTGAKPPQYLAGPTDGMADQVKGDLVAQDGQKAANAELSDGEFVLPADVVSHLGNGNSTAGAKVLYDMMERVRRERTGNPAQGKAINPSNVLPK